MNRLLKIPFTLFIISIISFYLGKLAPGDPAEIYTRNLVGGVEGNLEEADKIYLETREFLGLNKPSFYFSIKPKAFKNVGDLISNPEENKAVLKLISQTGNAEAVINFHKSLTTIQKLNDDDAVKKNISQIKKEFDFKKIENILENLAVSNDWKDPFQKMVKEKKIWNMAIPYFQWNGLDNQYHQWIVNPGLSFSDRQPVRQKIYKAIKWTLIMNGLAIFFTYLFSIPMGVIGGIYPQSLFDKITSSIFLILFSLPTFWIATLLVVFFTTPEYRMDWFPSMGIGSLDGNENFLEILRIRAQHLILPVFCLTYGSLAFVSRQMRRSTISVIKQDYIRTAFAKGLSQWNVVVRHVLPNALFPIITLLGGILPTLLAGSVAVEYIFNIPGMGKLTIDSILMKDWPVVFNILLLSSLLTIAGIWISDFLYAWFDPRVDI
jgi:peptide/nickel transport system permease protein